MNSADAISINDLYDRIDYEPDPEPEEDEPEPDAVCLVNQADYDKHWKQKEQ